MEKQTRNSLTLLLVAFFLLIGWICKVKAETAPSAINAQKAKGPIKHVNEYCKELQEAAEKGDSFSQFMHGFHFVFGGCESEGISNNVWTGIYWLEKAADQGSVWAMWNLSFIYEGSLKNGPPRALGKVLHWLKKAAEKGHDQAQCDLGIMYDTGEGVLQNDKQAVYWYRKATEEQRYPNAQAQYLLGFMYYEGRGVPQSYEYAYAWMSLAAAQEFENAAKTRDAVAKFLTPEQRAKAQDLAAELQAKIDSRKE